MRSHQNRIVGEVRAEKSGAPLFMHLDDGDSVVLEAVAEARRTLPQFLAAVSRGQFSQAGYLVKVPFVDRSATGEPALVRTSDLEAKDTAQPICHVWLRVTSTLEDLIFCQAAETPDALHLERGVGFVVDAAVIEDWLIKDDSVAYGGFSLRIIRGRLTREEQLEFDAHTGIGEFRQLLLGGA